MLRLEQRIGLVIKDIRLNRSLSQEELASRAGLHRTYLSDLERGARNASIRTVSKLSDALEIEIWMLLKLAVEAHASAGELDPVRDKQSAPN